MKIMSNEQLVAAYRDAEKNGQDRDWAKLLKDEIRKRGINPLKSRR
ncbi:sporulation histidine kinase inhibitor Sda [Falsibacillus albus]|uniref:Sporulation histidine kinase inhibitor Sda n=1 Tax=Falsibacillus albus TaxID=2478915 RepID=A0A3L7K0C8_9BACI|nr:sporulation histidine kinase inhibitor Sda [Falsibacillus albus]